MDRTRETAPVPREMVDGVELHWREAGDGPPLVLLHPGPGLDGAVLWPWFAPLAGERRVLALDLACSGRSGGGDPLAWTIERQAALVGSWLDELGLEAPVVLGHSYGSFVALTLAVRRPDRLAGVVASCGAASEHVFDDLEARLDAFGDPAVLAAFEAEEDVRTPQDCLAVWRGQLPFFLATTAPGLDAALAEVVFQPATVRGGAEESYDLREELRTLPTPLLAIGGAQDRCTPPEATRELAALAPRGAAEILDGAGHFAYAERPQAYLGALRAMLLSHPRPSQARGLRGEVTGP